MDFTMGHVASELGATFPAVEGTFLAISGAVARGQIVECDFTSPSTMRMAETASGLVRCVTPGVANTHAYFGGRVLVVSKQSVRQNREFKGVIQGFVPVIVVGVGTKGTALVIASDDNNGKRIWGRLLEAGGTVNVGTALNALWDGVTGFGQIAATAPAGAPEYGVAMIPIVDVPGGGPGAPDPPEIVEIPIGGGAVPIDIEVEV